MFMSECCPNQERMVVVDTEVLRSYLQDRNRIPSRLAYTLPVRNGVPSAQTEILCNLDSVYGEITVPSSRNL